jgi:hypothetical protein
MKKFVSMTALILLFTVSSGNVAIARLVADAGNKLANMGGTAAKMGNALSDFASGLGNATNKLKKQGMESKNALRAKDTLKKRVRRGQGNHNVGQRTRNVTGNRVERTDFTQPRQLSRTQSQPQLRTGQSPQTPQPGRANGAQRRTQSSGTIARQGLRIAETPHRAQFNGSTTRSRTQANLALRKTQSNGTIARSRVQPDGGVQRQGYAPR